MCYLVDAPLSPAMSQIDANEFSYRAIVFRLRNNPLDLNLPAKKLLKYRDVVITEHPPEPEGQCEWNELHYHGIVEHKPAYRFDSDRVFNQFKDQYCEWFKSEQCKAPVNFLAYMQIPPRRIVFENSRDDHSDLSLLMSQVTPELIQEVQQRKIARVTAKNEGSKDIMVLKQMIQESGAQSESELIPLFYQDPVFEHLYCKRTFSQNFRKALMFALQQTMDIPIRDLCLNFKDIKNECLSPNESCDLMEQWCIHQKIDPIKFVEDIANCLDRKKRKLNTIILKGEPNSGKTFIAKSLAKACVFFAEVTQAIGGYTFTWQDCVNKRLIIINEPYFDLCMIEKVKVILEGTGTFVNVKQKGDEYLRPTPVVITTNNYPWSNVPTAETAIRARCIAIYDNLKPADFLSAIDKDLSPMWLNLLAIKYARPATPIADFSDDEPECTSQVTTGVVQELTSNKSEKVPISWTAAANATTSSLLTPDLVEPSEKSIQHLLGAPLKQDPSVICSGPWSTQNQSSTASPILVDTYQDSSLCPNKSTPTSTSTTLRKRKEQENQDSLYKRIKQDLQDYQIPPATSRWLTELNKLESTSPLEGQEEEVKCPP